MRKAQLFGICFLLLFLTSCQPSRISLTPLPSRIERIEGHASLRIDGDQGSTRSKFSFVFQLPDQGRIEVSGALGRVFYRIVMIEGEAYFIVPSKKVYWRAQEEEIIDKFLGFRLSLAEMINLLSGKWRGGDAGLEAGIQEWTLVKDQKGRILSGQRGDLWFKIIEFIDNTPFARRLVFEHPLSSGQLKILHIGLNRPINDRVFSRQFLERYAPKTWEEIQELIEDAR